jgi:hypothetical protein
VGLRGERRHIQPLGDLVVGQPAGDQREHVALPVGQVVQREDA